MNFIKAKNMIWFSFGECVLRLRLREEPENEQRQWTWTKLTRTWNRKLKWQSEFQSAKRETETEKIRKIPHAFSKNWMVKWKT